MAREVIAERGAVGPGGIVETVVVPECYRSAWSRYSIMTDRRDQLRAGLGHTGIPATIYYPQRLHLQRGLAELGYAAGDLPIAELVSRRILSLPMHPALDQDTDQRVSSTLSAMRLRARPHPELSRASTNGLSRTVSLPDLPFAIDCFDNIDASFLSMGNIV